MFYIIEKNLISDISEMKSFIEDLLSVVKDKLCEDNIFDLKLILDELIYNSIVHGNESNMNKKIRIFIGICDRRIRVEVSDEGLGINYDKSKYDPLELNCGGRGLLIVDSLSDEFKIDNNKVICVKHRNP